MSFFQGFREFAVRGNVVDMGIGIIIGAAFGNIVTSFVSDVMMPPIGLIMGRVNFNNLYINLSGGHYKSLAEAEEAGAATINYGIFIENILHFVIIAFAAYLIIIQMNKLKRVSMDAAKVKTCPYCFSDIPKRALKCPKCTSVIVDEDRKKHLNELNGKNDLNNRRRETFVRINTK